MKNSKKHIKRDPKEIVGEQLREHRNVTMLYFVLRAFVVIIMLLQLIKGNYENVFLCALTLVLFLIPRIVEVNFHVDLPDTLEIIVLLFIFAAEILGELQSFYTYFPFWDSMLHTINGFLAAAIGFSMVDLLNRTDRFTFSLSPLFMAMVAFCFSMTIGVLWEFFEFGCDSFFGTDMQKDFIVTQINSVLFNPDGKNVVVHMPIESLVVNGEDWIAKYGGYIDIGIIDTMKDLLVNFVGAVVFSVIGYFYVKTRGKGKFVKRFILSVKDDAQPQNAVTEEIKAPLDGVTDTRPIAEAEPPENEK
ncbi:MAG: hypothetical protein WCQ72_06405 [Eubacteriales bacterium]